MTTTAFQPVILSGGSGRRLWPLSRADAPKHLIPLIDGRSTLLATLDRLDGLDVRPPVVVCNAAHASDVERDLEAAGVEGGRMIIEPVGRNTAPAVAAAALAAAGDAVMLVMPADHLIGEPAAFRRAVLAGAATAAAGDLVTFGIVPDHPATGYGYIETHGDGPVRPVARFVEKPDRTTAEQFVAAGHYLWNSGMFMFTAASVLDELDRHAPAVLAAVRIAVAEAGWSGTKMHLGTAAFSESPSISIDYAVMEHTDRAAVVPLEAGWTDLGSFESLMAIGERDDAGNVIEGRAVTRSTTSSYVRSDGPLVAALGVQSLIVVATPDAVLVADRSTGQQVTDLVGDIVAQGHREGSTAAVHHRPWGRRTVLVVGDDVQAERVDVLPGRGLAITSGSVTLISGDAELGGAPMVPGDVTIVPAGETRRFENRGPTDVVAIVTTRTGS